MFKKTLLGISLLTLMTVSLLAVPNQLTYSGRLLQNGALVNASLPMIFSIYTDPTAGNLLWTQSLPSVEVNQGIYSVILGNGNPISPNVFVTDNAYLQVEVNGEVLSPRTRINSVGYALQAGGLSNGGIQAVAVSTNGYVGIGTTNPQSHLSIGGANTVIISPDTIDGADVKRLVLGGAPGDATARGAQLELFGNEYNGGSVALYAGNASGNISFRTGPSSTETMKITSQNLIGIGTSNPAGRLHVVGQISDLLVTYSGKSGANQNVIQAWQRQEGITDFTTGLDVNNYFVIAPGNYIHSTTGLFINSAGNVGIGTPTPSARLELADRGQVASPYGILKISQDDNTVYGLMINNLTYSTTANYGLGLFVWNDGTAIIRGGGANVQGKHIILNDVTGNVGIGTTAPQELLNIASAISGQANIRIQKNRNSNSDNGGNIYFDYHANDYGAIAHESVVGAIRFRSKQGNQTDSDAALRLSAFIEARGNPHTGDGAATPTDLVFGTSPETNYVYAQERMRIDKDGNVGIGTTNPGAKLEVEGTAFNNAIAIFGPNQLYYAADTRPGGVNTPRPVLDLFAGGTGSYSYAQTWRLKMGKDGGAVSGAADKNTNQMILSTFTGSDSNATESDILTLKGNGNVGIGTTNPGEKLEVNGHAIATPVVGKWYQSTVRAGVGNFVWDNELFNTNPAYMVRADTNQSIQILKAGYYAVNAKVIQSGVTQGSRGTIMFAKNGTVFEQSLGSGSPDGYIKHSMPVINYFAANDKLTISNTDWSRYGDSGTWTVLEIHRLN
ncbi:MAG: hypothetical protein WC838_02410 [Candidatus Margulisiibacteriota bacterium]|jgi:hypothetical protein